MSASLRPKPPKSTNLTSAHREDCNLATGPCNNKNVVPFPRETFVPSPLPEPAPQPPTDAQINEAFNVLAQAHKAIIHDARLTVAFECRYHIEVLGRPSGTSPPKQAEEEPAPAQLPETCIDTRIPKSPRTERLWKEREEYHESPASFIMREYRESLSNLTREDIRSHDETLYKAMYRPQHKAAVDALGIPTLKQVNDRLIAERGIQPVTKRTVPAAQLDPETRLRIRLYSAQYRRGLVNG